MKLFHKSTITIFILSLLLSISGTAQDAKPVRIGLVGSGNVSWLKPNNDGGFGYTRKGVRLGYTAGIAMDFTLFGEPNYAFGTGINLLYHSGKLNYPDVVQPTDDTLFVGATTATYHLRYIEIPLTLKLKTNEIGYLTYYGQVGLGLGINIKARQDWKQDYQSGTYEPQEQDLNVSKQILFARIPLIIGAGVEYNISGNTSVLIGATFSNGFTNVFTKKAPLYELEDNGDVKLNSKGNPVEINGTKRNALTNYIGVNLGILF